MSFFQSILLFLFPTWFCKLLFIKSKSVVIGKNSKIGFSYIKCKKLKLGPNCKIGHLNYISVGGVYLKSGCYIQHLNFIRGQFDIIMEDNSWINNKNKISSIGNAYHNVVLNLNEGASIGVRHLLDMTDSITIGAYSMLAGADTQIWTHSFFFSKDSPKFARLDAPVNIGKHCYIGARCCILSGVNISDAVTVGAQTCVSKSLDKQGLYVSQGLRYIEFDPNKRISSFHTPMSKDFIFSKNVEERNNNK